MGRLSVCRCLRNESRQLRFQHVDHHGWIRGKGLLQRSGFDLLVEDPTVLRTELRPALHEGAVWDPCALVAELLAFGDGLSFAYLSEILFAPFVAEGYQLSARAASDWERRRQATHFTDVLSQEHHQHDGAGERNEHP